MRILHFSSATSWRGGEQQIAYLYEVLQKEAIIQWIFCVEEGVLANYCKQKGIPHFTYRKRFSINPLVAIQLKELCSKLEVSVVHLHDAHSHTFGYISALLGNSTPYVLSRRVDFPVKNNWLSHRKYNHASIKKILSVSNYVQTVLAPAIIDKSKLQVIHSGIDINRFQFKNQGILRKTYAISEETEIIANVAAIAPHKDYFTFVDTAAHLIRKDQRFVFLIIGADGGERAEIEAYIMKKGLTNYFILTDFRKDIPEILPEVDILLFTSKEEGLGTSLIDALACGVPVVATSAGGIPEIIKDGENGLLAPVRDAKLLAKKIIALRSDRRLQEKIINRGKQTALQFSKKIMGQKTIGIYKEVLTVKQLLIP